MFHPLRLKFYSLGNYFVAGKIFARLHPVQTFASYWEKGGRTEWEN